jgi:hypothetical protein
VSLWSSYGMILFLRCPCFVEPPYAGRSLPYFQNRAPQADGAVRVKNRNCDFSGTELIVPRGNGDSRRLFDGSRASLGTCLAVIYGWISRLARTIPMPR